MYRPPPLPGVPVLAGKKVLLIDCNERTREVRASIGRLKDAPDEEKHAVALYVTSFMKRK